MSPERHYPFFFRQTKPQILQTHAFTMMIKYMIIFYYTHKVNTKQKAECGLFCDILQSTVSYTSIHARSGQIVLVDACTQLVHQRTGYTSYI